MATSRNPIAKKWRRKLRRAYQNPTYEEAKAALKGLHKELQQMNRSAARSLEEGLEQTLTLHRSASSRRLDGA